MNKQERETEKADLVLWFRKVNLMTLKLDTLKQLRALIEQDPRRD